MIKYENSEMFYFCRVELRKGIKILAQIDPLNSAKENSDLTK